MNNRIGKLEKKMVTYKKLTRIKQNDIGDKLIPLDKNLIMSAYKSEFNDMERVVGPAILVREKVAERLYQAQKLLKTGYPFLSLYVTYGYRSLEIQTNLFVKELRNNTLFFSNPEDLYEEIHRYVAVPNVAGHPTGGAIDVVLFDELTKKFADFGSQQYDFSNKRCYVFSPSISKIGRDNRQVLRNTMMSVGFAPFDGEWWHFSFGDREWAYYYGKKQSIFARLL